MPNQGKGEMYAWFPWSGSGQPFRINLSGHYPRYLALLRLGLAALSLGLLCGIAWDLQRASASRAQAAKLGLAVHRVVEQDRQFLAQTRGEGLALSDALIKQLPRDIAFVNRVAAKRNFSWTTLLSELEQTVPPGLAISSIQNDFKQSIMIHLSGSALTLDAVTDFILTLANHRAFYDPLLVQHRVKSADGLVEFTLKVGYQGGSA